MLKVKSTETSHTDRLKIVKEFEKIKETAELNTLSKESLARELNPAEFQRFKALALKLHGIKK